MTIRLALVFSLCFFSCTILIAQQQSKQYQFRRIDLAKGLSHNQITCIFKDSKGFMWFGTMSGLNRYDGYLVKVFKSDPKDSATISDDYIIRIAETPDSKLLILTRNGLNIYDPNTEQFDHNISAFLSRFSLPGSSFLNIVSSKQDDAYFLIEQQGIYKYIGATKKTLRLKTDENSFVATFAKDQSGDIWVINDNGIIEKFDGKTNRAEYRSGVLAQYMKNERLNYGLFVDKQGELWIYAHGDPRGVFRFEPSTGQLAHIKKEEGRPGLNTNLVIDITQDNKSQIWVCTDHGGINIINKNDYSIQYLLNNPDDNNSLSQNSTTSAYKDNDGIIWVGTFKKGISYYHEGMIKFPLYRHQPSNPNSLTYDDVNRFAEDANGNLWIGTNGGGLIYFDRKQGKFRQYRHQPSKPNSLSNDVIVSLWIDKKQKLWIGTYYGGLDCFDGKNFIHYKHDPADSTTIADNRVWEIYEDRSGNLWVGMLGGGLDRFDRETGIFHHYKVHAPNSIHSAFISAITENKNGDIWVGTAYGIDVLEKKSGLFFHYDTNPDYASGLSNNNIISIYVDSKNRSWVGTREGLNLFNSSTKKFQYFTVKDGLPDNAILNILEDEKGNLWISTPNGISKVFITESTEQKGVVKILCKNYEESDGLQGIQFNENAALRTRNGELIFGGPNGFNIFHPQNILPDNHIPKIVFTDFEIFNRSIKPGEVVDGNVLLPQSITQTPSVTLSYNQNVIAIEFAALNFSNPEKNKYAYILEGFNKEWLSTDGKMRKAIFTNLDPGTYTFRVKTANDKGGWNNNEVALRIKILPPFWKTPLAYVIYILLVTAALHIARLMIIRKAKARFAIEQERQEAQRMHELDLMKIKFFTNVSHEFRTPLSLILAPVDKMLKQPTQAANKQQLQLVQRNAKRLLNLVNQLLDFRKMEERELKLHTKEGDIIQYISNVSHFFSDVADKKNISFSFHSNLDHLQTSFDHDKIERILFNLLSNAFKFTPENGHVGVDVKAKETDSTSRAYELEIKVHDTGIGIEKEKHDKIFERFFQSDIPGSMVNQGSGIGLAITKEFVKLHGGDIWVESEINKGSSFFITLSLVAAEAHSSKAEEEDNFELYDNSINNGTDEENVEIAGEEIATGPKQKNKKQSVLIIEDNDDFRFYLKDNLKEHFAIIEATNGKQGWQKALGAHPDMIVSDVSMPEMDGIELCKKIKTDKRTTHIPVILLTALSGEGQQLKGLGTGANDYMTKPFTFEILLSKIKNLLNQQEQAKKTYQKQVEVKPSEVVMESPSEKFMQQLLLLVEKNISEPDFSVEDMSRQMYMSRVALYKKVLSLTGKTPIEFLRQVRLKRAVQLLEKGEMTISQIAFEVGFNNPKYFSKYFKAEYGKLPSVYMEDQISSSD